MSESTYEDLPPPPDGLHGGEESMDMTSPNNQGHSTSRALVSPRPIKNHVHDIQVCKVKIQNHLVSVTVVCTMYILHIMYVLKENICTTHEHTNLVSHPNS